MDTFDDIRPYRDDEFVPRLRRLIADPAVVQAVSAFVWPKLNQYCPALVQAAMRQYLRAKTFRLQNVEDLQLLIAKYMHRLVRTTTNGFTYSGLEHLDPRASHLFISNHRDITLDTCFMNYALWLNTFPTTQTAVGDNLFSHGFATEFMRLNKSFIVVRNAEGARALYAAMGRTSSYIRRTLEGRESIWIAQREGRAKDGFDQTDPAIFKMFMLAYKQDLDSLSEWLARVNLVPCTLSYELDPCAPKKARELHIRKRDGAYEKAEREDLQSIIRGIVGFKGRVHVAFAKRVKGTFESVEDLAKEVDRQIYEGFQPFPTYAIADQRLNGKNTTLRMRPNVRQEFESQLTALDEEERSLVLLQYANQNHTGSA